MEGKRSVTRRYALLMTIEVCHGVTWTVVGSNLLHWDRPATQFAWHTWHPCTRNTLRPYKWSLWRRVGPARPPPKKGRNRFARSKGGALISQRGYEVKRTTADTA